MNIFRKTAIAAALCLINLASFAENVESNVVASGSSSALSLNAYIAPTSNFIGNNSKLYLAIVLGNSVYFYSDTAGFVPYAGGLTALVGSNPAEAPPVRAITKSTEAISLTGDATAVVGADIYVGYGTSFAELISSGRYAKKYTIANGPAPIPVFKTSYENFNGYGLSRIKFPSDIATAGDTIPYATADFLQNGTITAVVTKWNYASQTTPAAVMEQDKAQYYSETRLIKWDVNGNPVTIWSDKGNTCRMARHALTADFNNDGYPDVFVGCSTTSSDNTGSNNIIRTASYMLWNDKNGGFNVRAITDGFGGDHASAADVNGDGLVDIAVADIMNNPDGYHAVYFLMNNGNGAFTKDYTRIINLTSTQWNPYFTTELLDVDGDGIIDLFVSGNENDGTNFGGAKTKVLFGDGNGKFGARQVTIAQIPTRDTVQGVNVVTNNGKRGLFINRTKGCYVASGCIHGTTDYNSRTLQWVDVNTWESSIALDLEYPQNPITVNGIKVAVWIDRWLVVTKNGQTGVDVYNANDLPNMFTWH